MTQSAGPIPQVSTSSLYEQELASMNIKGGFNQLDSPGVVKVHAIRLMAHAATVRRKHKHWSANLWS